MPMKFDEVSVNVIGTLKCKKCGGELSEVKLKEKFMSETARQNQDKLVHFMCLKCLDTSHNIRKVLMGEDAANDLYPIYDDE